MKRDAFWFISCVAVLVALCFGLWAGARIVENAKLMEIAELQAVVETTQAALADANVESAFWKSTVKSLSDGDQLGDIDLGRKIEDEEEAR